MLPNHKLLGLFDALYANGPHIKLLKKQDMSYIIGIKNGPAYELAKEFKKEGLLHEVEWEKDGKHCKVCYWNGFTLNISHPNVLVNYFDYTETNQKTGKVYFSSWITDLTIRKEIVTESVTVAHSRWKVKNSLLRSLGETFNTLKNQGYHLEHNYGHGKYNLATNFAILTFLVFLIDQMAQYFDSFFQAAWKEKKIKKDFGAK